MRISSFFTLTVTGVLHEIHKLRDRINGDIFTFNSKESSKRRPEISLLLFTKWLPYLKSGNSFRRFMSELWRASPRVSEPYSMVSASGTKEFSSLAILSTISDLLIVLQSYEKKMDSTSNNGGFKEFWVTAPITFLGRATTFWGGIIFLHWRSGGGGRGWWRRSFGCLWGRSSDGGSSGWCGPCRGI